MILNPLILDIQDAWRNLFRRPLRSLLSGLGIGIGVAALIAMLSITEGAKRAAFEKFNSLGLQTLRIEATSTKSEKSDSTVNLSQGIIREDGGAESDLERIKRSAEIHIQKKADEVEKNRRDVENKRTALENARAELVNCDVYSPADGVLLYPELPRENGRRKIQIGDSVWVGQTFMEIPDTRELIVELPIREVDIAQIGPGMKTEIRVDAFPGRTFDGVVESVASLAKEDLENRHLRRFHTRVRLTGDTDKLHVGMSATAKIVYQEIEEVVAIPSSAVFYKEKQSMVRKLHAEAVADIPVDLGARGQLWVEIIDGLQVGDRIYSEGH